MFRLQQLLLLFRIYHNSMQEPSDRKSTRLNSSHTVISYAVFCLKKKISLNESNKYKKLLNDYSAGIN